MLSHMIESLHFFSNKRSLSAVLLLGVALFLLLSLMTFNYQDTSFFYRSVGFQSDPTHNYAGVCGAYCAAFFLYFLGSAALLIVPCLLCSALATVALISKRRNRQVVSGLLLLIVGQALLSYQMGIDWHNQVSPGGLMGMYGTFLGYYFIKPSAFFIITFLLNCLGLALIVQFAWVRPFIQGTHACICFLQLDNAAKRGIYFLFYPFKKINAVYRNILAQHIYKKYLTSSSDFSENRFTKMVHELIFDDPFWQNCSLHSTPRLKERASCYMQSDVVKDTHDVLQECKVLKIDSEKIVPEQHSFVKPLDVLFRTVRAVENSAEEEHFIKERARNLESKLALFGIEGKVVSITAGPVVTLFEYSPARDVKISKIVLLEDDLSLALEAHSLRIIAPIPGRSVVGFEVANNTRQTVHFSEIAASKGFKNYAGSLPLIIGRDTTGNDVIVDLADMPHALVAGSTGSGKSVALNAMLTSLLCKVHPDEVRLILIDPKRLEFAAFSDIPHLVFPIITEVARVPLVLGWAVKMMEDRYSELARAGVRHVSEYHKKYGVAAMPYTVIVIDELADLMMASKNSTGGFSGSRSLDIEGLIARLAQMSRAAGIHLIIATQRPSVDVITGLIKVNFPSRIACKVISKVDSRTILDHAGAEKLLGKGDMLFLNHKGFIARVHGAYVRDDEILEVVSYVKSQQAVVYQELAMPSNSHSDELVSDEDPLYPDVCAYVTTMSEVSISLLQRKFRIGYNRSARLIDTLEARGIVLPADGSKFRKVASYLSNK